MEPWRVFVIKKGTELMNNLIILNIRQQRKKLDNIKTSRLLLFVPRKDSGLQCLLLKKPWPNSKHRRSTRSIFVFDVWELLVTSSNRGVSISLGCSRRSGDPPVVYLISADLGGSQTFFALHLPRQPGIGARFGHAKMWALVTESTKPFLFRIFGFVSINRNSRQH